MPSHPETQAAFRTGIAGGRLPAGLTAPGDVERRFAVYRNNVLHSLTEALRQRFPVVERLLGTDCFRAFARRFAQEHPPEDPRIIVYGERLPGYLAAWPEFRSLPYLADVARLELARGAAYHAGDAAALDPAHFIAAATGGGDDLALCLHPSLRLVRSPWPIVTIWRANRPGAGPEAMRPEGQTALVFRQGSAVPVLAVGAAEAAFFGALRAGTPLVDAARTAAGTESRFSMPDALALLIRHSLITDTAITQKKGDAR